jgi:glycosyltransferase involved in cell wall biosynthesis
MFEETVPSKLFEILACEVPLIASVAGEAAEILASAGVGCVVPPGDAISLSVAILRELAKPRESRARAGAGRRFVEESFSRTALADRYLHLLSTVVGLSSGHSSSRQ